MLACPRTDLSHDFCDGCAKRSEAVQHGNTDLNFGYLTVGLPGHEALSEQPHAAHLRFGPTSAVVSAPFLPDRPAEAFQSPKSFVSRNRACGDTADLLIWRGLGHQFRSYWRIAELLLVNSIARIFSVSSSIPRWTLREIPRFGPPCLRLRRANRPPGCLMTVVISE